MSLNELIQCYKTSKHDDAANHLDLLTMAKKLYISNEITFQHYKELIKDLEPKTDHQ